MCNNIQESEIQFVQELYFLIVTDNNQCVPVGYNIDFMEIKKLDTL